MEVTAKLRYLRIAPRKVRLLADLIRGKKAAEAKTLLDFSLKKGAQPMKKLLGSAVASAKHDFQLEEPSLYVSKITVDEGPKLKRWRARSRGRAMQIQKKTSHVTLILEGEKKPSSARASVETQEKTLEKRDVSSAETRGVPLKRSVPSKDKQREEAEPKPLKKVSKPKRRISPGLAIKKKALKKIFRRKSF